MTIPTLTIRFAMASALALSFAAALPPADAAARKNAHQKKTEPAEKTVGEVVTYDALEQHVGQDVVIDTTLDTVRRGTLMKYTQPALTIKITPEAGGFELTVPRDTVKKVTVLPQPAVLDKDGKDGAKKD